MKWSWKMGRLFGIDVHVHATFWLLVGWIGLMHWMQERTVAAVMAGTFFILALFVCVLLHELGHSLAARRYGIGTRDITLLPIGGVARLERMPTRPSQELWVALAGPLVNVVIAGGLFVGLWATQTFEPLASLGVANGSVWERLMVVNLFLAAFNLLPAFPMDGGRVLRALLAMRWNYLRATQTAAGLGQVMALLFGLAGLVFNPFLILIALFVWMGARQEAQHVLLQSLLNGVPVSRVMQLQPAVVGEQTSAAEAWALLLRTGQRVLPVVDGQRVVGVVTPGDLVAALDDGRSVRVGDVARRKF